MSRFIWPALVVLSILLLSCQKASRPGPLPGRVNYKLPASPGLRVVTFNCQWLFDSDPSDQPRAIDDIVRIWPKTHEGYQKKLQNVARVLISLRADIYALQEIEDQDVLDDLCEIINSRLDGRYQSYFKRGTDNYTYQNVGYITHLPVKNPPHRFPVKVSKHLFLHVQVGGEDVYLLNLHFKARSDERSQRKREGQARALQPIMGEYVRRNHNAIILGDVNCMFPYKPRSNNLAENKGAAAILAGWQTDTLTDDYEDVNRWIAEEKRGTHGKSQLDRILISPAIERDDPNHKDLSFQQAGVISDIDRATSDHNAMWADFVIK